jgi:DNA-binding PadR family transcriptional regulator
MLENESILDKVISSQQSALSAVFNLNHLLNHILKDLKEREASVLSLRYGFQDNKKRTLEEIGTKFNITRERVRQIENAALKKVKKIADLGEHLKPLEAMVGQLLTEKGGIMFHPTLVSNIAAFSDSGKNGHTAVSFILSELLSDKFHAVKGDADLDDSWKLPESSLLDIKKTVEVILRVIHEAGHPLTLAEIINTINQDDLPMSYRGPALEPVVESLLEISRKTSANPFKEWGFSDWNSVMLKRMSDKIYLVLQKEGKPMHFTEIANKINEIGFDGKKANPATIHNELILDKKYVLIGRGIYALAEWGYKPGVVSEVIEEVLREAGEPLKREEIIQKVMKRRLVKRSTIILSLTNKKRFKRVEGGRYFLADNK